MKEIMEKALELEYMGLKPSLLIIGKKQQNEIRIVTLGVKTEKPAPGVQSFDIINLNGNSMKIVFSEENDLCEIYAKEKSYL